MEDAAKKILISVGEASGDMHAANLVHEIKKIAPNTIFFGMGASLMQAAGVKLLFDSGNLSIIGGVEILTKFPQILAAFGVMKKALFCDKPDLLILVDYPGFNLRLAKVAKKAGVKVLYFISPKIWAWHQSRIKIIKKYVDVMAVIFPFEVDFYRKWQVDARFVGNPLCNMVRPTLSVQDAKKAFNLDANCKTIGLFPGSRKGEIKRLLPIMIKTAELLKNKNPYLQFLLPQAISISDEDLAPYLCSSSIKIQVIKNQNYDVMQVCDAIIAASGTVTLEIALLEIPLVIIYAKSWLEGQIIKRLVKIPYIGLCNILSGKKIVQELLQDDATAEKIALEVEKILSDTNYRLEMIKNLNAVKAQLVSDKKTDLAELVLGMVH